MGETTTDLDASPGTLEAALNFVADDGTTIITAIVHADGREERSGGAFDTRSVTIHNGRRRQSEHSLDREGFRLVRHGITPCRLDDEDDIRRVYYPAMEALIAELCKARRVIIFDHVLRRSAGPAGRQSGAARAAARPILGVHADYSASSGAERARVVAESAAEALGGSFAIIQAWGAVGHPVETDPLAILDASTVSPDQLVISERRHPARVAQSYALVYRPTHQWFWFPRMRCDEVLLFKGYDSRDDGRARWAVHSAFGDPTAPPDAKPRESIEIRSLAIF